MDEPDDATHELLAHAAWLRRLARELVRDASTADELVQRTWIAALERPPLAGSSLRGWLAAVLRNFARQDRRAGDRRIAREHVAARPEELPPGDTQLEKLELQRKLMDAVLALPEPYRAVVVQRYYDELAPREIARRTNVPLKTVKTRLARAQSKLREALDREHGSDRSAWLALVVPWISSDGIAASTAGGLIVNAKLKIGIGVAALAGTIAAVAHWLPPHSPELDGAPSRANASATLEAPSEIEPAVELATAAPARAEVSVPVAEALDVEPVVEAPKPKVRGRVVDASGGAVASIDVFGARGTTAAPTRGHASSLARTDARGEFECEYPREASRLEAESSAWTTVFAPSLERVRDTSEYLVVVAPRVAVHGRIVDEARQGVAGAQVIVQFGEAVRASFGLVLDDAVAICPEVTADAEGRFELPVVPACNGLLLVKHAGFDMKSVPIPGGSAFDVEIVLQKTPEKHTIVRGIVVDAQKRPVEGALVSHGAAIERTGADGLFEFDFAHAIGTSELVHDDTNPGAWKRSFDWLCAVKAGYRPARAPLPPSPEIRATEPFFTLVLADPPLSIRGRVVDGDGRAVRAAEVWLADPTPFGNEVRREGEMWMAWKTSVEDALNAEKHRRGTIADADGNFTLGGLLDREYAIVTFDPATMRWIRTERVRAGREDVVIALPEQPVERVAGRLVSRRGKPIAGAQVRTGRLVDPKEPPRFTESRTTDADGRFDFGEIVIQDLHFQITGERVKIEIDIVPPRHAKLSALELEASLECHVRVDLGAKRSLADSFAVFDAQGERKEMLAYRGASALVGDTFSIHDGVSDVVVVDESCTEIVLYKETNEVKRMPLVLETTGVTTVSP